MQPTVRNRTRITVHQAVEALLAEVLLVEVQAHRIPLYREADNCPIHVLEQGSAVSLDRVMHQQQAQVLTTEEEIMQRQAEHRFMHLHQELLLLQVTTALEETMW